MLNVISPMNNIFFNLALEEYLLKEKTEDIFMLWISEPAVVIGKHQNCYAEINLKYISENGLNIARRISGGGTVVHDLQNLNYTFIANGEEGRLINFKKYLNPVIDFLDTLGIDSKIGNTNEILIGDYKISGNAEHVYRKRVLHHGTLLFNSDLTRLKNAIRTIPGRFVDKAVQSNRAHVINIINHLKTTMTIENFQESLSAFISQKFPGTVYYKPGYEELQIVERLRKEKYQTEDWIFGYSPRYTFSNHFDWEGKSYSIVLNVEKGIITEAQIMIGKFLHEQLTKAIKNKPHRYHILLDIISRQITIKNIREFCYNFFQ